MRIENMRLKTGQDNMKIKSNGLSVEMAHQIELFVWKPVVLSLVPRLPTPILEEVTPKSSPLTSKGSPFYTPHTH